MDNEKLMPQSNWVKNSINACGRSEDEVLAVLLLLMSWRFAKSTM